MLKLIAVLLSLALPASALAAASIVPAFGTISSAGNGSKISAAQQGTNTLQVVGSSGATVALTKVSSKPKITIGLDSTVVKTSGDQTIGGVKTFTSQTKTTDILMTGVLGPWVDARSYATLADADTAAYNANKLLIISTVYTTVPATLTANIKVLPGGQLAGTGSTEITGKFEGADNCIGANRSIAGLAKATPEMFGAAGDGVTMDTTAVSAAMVAADEVYLARNYKVTYLTTARPVRFAGPGRIQNTSINKHIVGYLEGTGNGVQVLGGNFGPMPAGSTDDFAAIYAEDANGAVVAFNNITGVNTGVRFSYTATDRARDGLALGNYIVGSKQMGVENIHSDYNRVIGNSFVNYSGTSQGIHGIRVSGTSRGIIAGLNSVRNKRNAMSYQIGAVNSIAVGNYVERPLSGYEDSAVEATAGKHVISSTIVKDAASHGFDIDWGQGYRIDGMVDGAASQGIITATNAIDGKHRIDLSIFNTGSTAANIRNGKNLVTLLVDGPQGGTPVSIGGDNNLVLVLVTGTSLTNTIYATGNYNTFIIQESGTGTTALRVDGTGNQFFGRVTGNVLVNGDDNIFNLSGGGTLTLASGADGNTVSGKFSGSITDSGASNNLAGIHGKFTGATASIGGGALVAGACTSGTVTIAGATTGMTAIASPVTYPGDGAYWQAYVSSANTVTVKVCATLDVTPTTSAYNVRVRP